MLDLPAEGLAEGGDLPRGWHFFLLGADTQRSKLRADGFPGLGVPMPELGLPRLLLVGRDVTYHRDLPIGARVLRHSAIQNVAQKTSGAGPMAVATIAHTLQVEGESALAISETQTYMLLPALAAPAVDKPSPPCAISAEERSKIVVPDDTLLFQYSALGFNSHKIHLDRSHARQVEGFPDLVVNGGLATLLLLEFMRSEFGLSPKAIRVKHLKPLFCRHPMTLVARRDGGKCLLRALNEKNALAIDMEVELA